VRRRSSQKIQDRRGLEALHRLALELPGVLTLTGVTDMLAEHLVLAIARADECTISSWDAEQDEVTILSVCERDAGFVESYRGERYPLTDWPLSRELLTGGADHAEYRRSDPGWNDHARAQLEEWGWRSWITVPLVIGARPVGLIDVVDYRRSDGWSADDVSFCRTIASQAAMAIRSAQLHDHLRQVRHDPVTGLLGARSLWERLAEALEMSGEDSAPAVIVVRLQGITASAGDEAALQQVADAVRARCREGDIAGRTGADELVLVLPRADPETARAVTKRIEAAIADRAGLRALTAVAMARPDDRHAQALIDRARSDLPRGAGSDRRMSA
jgi:GGDEF domain-containing protein